MINHSIEYSKKVRIWLNEYNSSHCTPTKNTVGFMLAIVLVNSLRTKFKMHSISFSFFVFCNRPACYEKEEVNIPGKSILKVDKHRANKIN